MTKISIGEQKPFPGATAGSARLHLNRQPKQRLVGPKTLYARKHRRFCGGLPQRLNLSVTSSVEIYQADGLPTLHRPQPRGHSFRAVYRQARENRIGLAHLHNRKRPEAIPQAKHIATLKCAFIQQLTQGVDHFVIDFPAMKTGSQHPTIQKPKVKQHHAQFVHRDISRRPFA
ncbi:hypothetical protein CSB86_6897 [Pseudomonas aeruginosa]|nr:hypothetical protein CSB86_6897 [Pseudomonas aeruginosa]